MKINSLPLTLRWALPLALLCSLFFALLWAMAPGVAYADVVLPKIFTSNMVLQRELAVPIW
ncbi:MAG: hypothetical protein AAF989_14065, partial [Planctomycetota bacterium]